jgi:hypothetical protein
VEPAADLLSHLGKNLNKTSKLVWLIHSAMPRIKPKIAEIRVALPRRNQREQRITSREHWNC